MNTLALGLRMNSFALGLSRDFFSESDAFSGGVSPPVLSSTTGVVSRATLAGLAVEEAAAAVLLD